MEVNIEVSELVRKPCVLNGGGWLLGHHPALSGLERAPRCPHFTGGETKVQREAVSWSRTHMVKTLSPCELTCVK